jgi:hypothetical protein
MTQVQYDEGQDVEVQYDDGEGGPRDIIWRKATICDPLPVGNEWVVQFTDNSRGVFDAEHIRLSKRRVDQELIKNGEHFLDAMGDEVKP